jgi:DNA/RNA-binding domain of Phe-tRNA-synthetase-like protein
VEAGGRVAPALAAEFPGLRLRTAEVRAAGNVLARSPRELRERLAGLSNRYRGAQAVALRREPVPFAHRVFFRHIGLDPDVHRVPIEEAVVERLLKGAFASRRLLEDALLVALVETGVAVWALDAGVVEGGLELRVGGPGADGGIVVADARGVMAPIFAPPPADRAPRKETRAVLLYAVQVPSVPDVFVEEALWTAEGLLADGA